VSSSGHLTIGSALFGIDAEENLTFAVVVHIATVFSTLTVLWSEVVRLVKGFFKGLFSWVMNSEMRYVINIIISMIPIAIVGFFFKEQVETIFSSGYLSWGVCCC